MSLPANAVQVMTSLTSVAGHVAALVQDPHLEQAIIAATAGAAQAASCNAMLEAQLMTSCKAQLEQMQADLTAMYAQLKARSDVYAEINGIT